MSEEELLTELRSGAINFDDRAMELIHSYTQEKCREAELNARIDEINYLDDSFQEDAQDWMRDHAGYTTAMIPMEDYVKRRTELQAQLNKSKGEEDT